MIILQVNIEDNEEKGCFIQPAYIEENATDKELIALALIMGWFVGFADYTQEESSEHSSMVQIDLDELISDGWDFMAISQIALSEDDKAQKH